MVNMKKELRKIFIWVTISILFVALYKIYISILYNDWDYFSEYLKGWAEYPQQTIFYFFPYIAYRIISLLLILLQKIFHLKFNYDKISSIVVICIFVLLFLKIIAEESILYKFCENRYSGFVTDQKDVTIDSTNFYNYVWSRKIIDSEGYGIYKQKLWFKNDTTAVITGYIFNMPQNIVTSTFLYKYMFNKFDDKYTQSYLFKDSLLFIGKDNIYTLKLKNRNLITNFY